MSGFFDTLQDGMGQVRRKLSKRPVPLQIGSQPTTPHKAHGFALDACQTVPSQPYAHDPPQYYGAGAAGEEYYQDQTYAQSQQQLHQQHAFAPGAGYNNEHAGAMSTKMWAAVPQQQQQQQQQHRAGVAEHRNLQSRAGGPHQHDGFQFQDSMAQALDDIGPNEFQVMSVCDELADFLDYADLSQGIFPDREATDPFALVPGVGPSLMSPTASSSSSLANAVPRRMSMPADSSGATSGMGPRAVSTGKGVARKKRTSFAVSSQKPVTPVRGSLSDKPLAPQISASSAELSSHQSPSFGRASSTPTRAKPQKGVKAEPMPKSAKNTYSVDDVPDGFQLMISMGQQGQSHAQQRPQYSAMDSEADLFTFDADPACMADPFELPPSPEQVFQNLTGGEFASMDDRIGRYGGGVTDGGAPGFSQRRYTDMDEFSSLPHLSVRRDRLFSDSANADNGPRSFQLTPRGPTTPRHNGGSIPGTPTSGGFKKSRRKPKTYQNKEPSLYCHICARDSRRTASLVCGNFEEGTCRKITCKLCFEKLGMDIEHLRQQNPKWICTHCTNMCPVNARCHIYDRINAKRERNKGSEGVVTQ
ncbi:hypothetical protein FVE85_2351 [Porphyridium purpureum]|uniref:Zinc-finger domain-containing protein n=1 Tax=Porphyridium purpureum TaxID=35688 RepID=A0A5J4YXW4_PORPP|nr:hypothetical protein FVE85_2351 [Porphyridium purpureum]|eukprot:POR3768..scf209_3